MPQLSATHVTRVCMSLAKCICAYMCLVLERKMYVRKCACPSWCWVLFGAVHLSLFAVQEVAGLGGSVRLCKMEVQTEVYQKIFSEFVSDSAFK